MTEFTNQQLIDQAREEVDFWRERDELIPSQQTAIRLRLAEIAMAALMTPEPEPVADVVAWSSPSEERTCDGSTGWLCTGADKLNSREWR